VKCITTTRDPTHDGKTETHSVLFFLKGLQVVPEILDALPDGRFVVILEVLKDLSPNRHFRRTMRGKARAKARRTLVT
jgi:hypothetical protein